MLILSLILATRSASYVFCKRSFFTPFLFHALEHLSFLNVLQVLPSFSPFPSILSPRSGDPLCILVCDLLREMSPLESLQILQIPYIIVVVATLLPSNNVCIQCLDRNFCLFLRYELHPTISE